MNKKIALGAMVSFALSSAPFLTASSAFSAEPVKKNVEVAHAHGDKECNCDCKCGEGKCGAETKAKDAKCGGAKAKEAKCGEGTCGGKK